MRFSGRPRTTAVKRPLELCASPAPLWTDDTETWTPHERELIEAIFAATGHDIAHYRTNTLRRRVWAVLRTLRVGSINEALSKIAASPAMANRALSSLLIGHTLAFRDEPVFLRLENEILSAESEGASPW